MARVLSESDTVLAGFIEVLDAVKKRRVGLLRRWPFYTKAHFPSTETNDSASAQGTAFSDKTRCKSICHAGALKACAMSAREMDKDWVGVVAGVAASLM
jgi:hypothetical protein